MGSITTDEKIYTFIDYQDPYVQPLILSALEKNLPANSYHPITSLSELPSPDAKLLQWRQYEDISWDQQMSYSGSSLANAYIIRKALIRKHYLSTTVANWITKHPDSCLKRGVKPSVEFEVDYAEFLDDALVEAYELRESWDRGKNESYELKEPREREWWILKPGMSERGQGIRLFSSEEELTEIFEAWDPESDDEDDEDDARSDAEEQDRDAGEGNGIITSQLRHFIAQPYIHPPLLLPSPGSAPDAAPTHKFHIRTYVLTVGALKVYVYRDMLALFAARPYSAPWETISSSEDSDGATDQEEALRAHLTNTCLQDSSDREGSVALFWNLPSSHPSLPMLPPNWKDAVFKQLLALTGETFKAAAQSMSIHFQTLPNSFEIFGLDFMVGVEADGGLNTYLLEVNAFPDFRQTGGELKGVVEGLFEGVVDVGIVPFFGGENGEGENEKMIKVLDVDMGRR